MERIKSLDEFKPGCTYTWEGHSEIYIMPGRSLQNNIIAVYTESYGKERSFVIEAYHLEQYEFTEIEEDFLPSNVIGIGGVTRLDIPVEKLRDNINWESVEDALVVILDKEGEVQAYSNRADGKKSLYLASRFSHKYLSGDYS